MRIYKYYKNLENQTANAAISRDIKNKIYLHWIKNMNFLFFVSFFYFFLNLLNFFIIKTSLIHELRI